MNTNATVKGLGHRGAGRGQATFGRFSGRGVLAGVLPGRSGRGATARPQPTLQLILSVAAMQERWGEEAISRIFCCLQRADFFH